MEGPAETGTSTQGLQRGLLWKEVGLDACNDVDEAQNAVLSERPVTGGRTFYSCLRCVQTGNPPETVRGPAVAGLGWEDGGES